MNIDFSVEYINYALEENILTELMWILAAYWIYVILRGCDTHIDFQPRSQGSLLPALRSERERDLGKRWSRGSRTKLFLREESFVLHSFVWFIRDIHAEITAAR